MDLWIYTTNGLYIKSGVNVRRGILDACDVGYPLSSSGTEISSGVEAGLACDPGTEYISSRGRRRSVASTHAVLCNSASVMYPVWTGCARPAARGRRSGGWGTYPGEGMEGGAGHVARANDHAVAGRRRALIGPSWRLAGVDLNGGRRIGSQLPGCC